MPHRRGARAQKAVLPSGELTGVCYEFELRLELYAPTVTLGMKHSTREQTWKIPQPGP